MAYSLADFIDIIDTWGVTDILLPFLLIFVLVFAVLQKSNIFGKDKKKFNVAIAVIMGLLVVIPHATGNYPSGYDVVDIINSALPSVSLIVVAVVMLLLLLGLFGEPKFAGTTISGWIALLAFITIAYIFGSSAGWWQGWDWLTNVFGEDTIALVIIILVFAIIINFIVSEPKEGKQAGAIRSIGDAFKDIFTGGGK